MKIDIAKYKVILELLAEELIYLGLVPEKDRGLDWKMGILTVQRQLGIMNRGLLAAERG